MSKAPIVLVNHSLTGDANLTGDGGWWTEIIGKGKIIDTDKYTILGFNIQVMVLKVKSLINQRIFIR